VRNSTFGTFNAEGEFGCEPNILNCHIDKLSLKGLVAFSITDSVIGMFHGVGINLPSYYGNLTRVQVGSLSLVDINFETITIGGCDVRIIDLSKAYPNTLAGHTVITDNHVEYLFLPPLIYNGSYELGQNELKNISFDVSQAGCGIHVGLLNNPLEAVCLDSIFFDASCGIMGGRMNSIALDDRTVMQECSENNNLIVIPTSNLTVGVPPFSVEFTGLLQQGGGSVREWLWDFGDGTYSSEQNPSHTFTEIGDYYVKLIGTNMSGVSFICDTYLQIRVDEFLPPNQLLAVPSQNSVCLRWNLVPLPEIEGYRIFRGTSSTNLEFLYQASATDTTFIDMLPPHNHDIYYAVSTVYSNGRTSFLSNSVSTQLLPSVVVSSESLSVSKRINQQSNATLILENTGGGWLHAQLLPLFNSEAGCAVTALPATLDLPAPPLVNQAGISLSLPSNCPVDGHFDMQLVLQTNDASHPFDTLTVSAYVSVNPPSPVDNFACLPYADFIQLSWRPAPEADEVTRYRIYRGLNPNAMTLIQTITNGDTTWADTAIPDPSRTYKYGIRAVDTNDVEGEMSAIISTYLNIPSAVTGLQIALQGTGVQLTWQPVSSTVYGDSLTNITGYIVYSCQNPFDEQLNFVAFTPELSYLQTNSTLFTRKQFYRVAAYVGTMQALSERLSLSVSD
jgi:PKD repeat protein